MSRLFFDLETSYNIVKGIWDIRNVSKYIDPSNIIKERKIICVAWKWEGEEEVYTLDWGKKQDDKRLLKQFIKQTERATEVIAHNGDRFDIKWIRTRALIHGLEFPYKINSYDTLKKVKTYYNFNSNKLDYIGKILGLGRKITNEKGLWDKVIIDNDKEALDKMLEYCKKDVILLEDVYNVINSHLPQNTHYGVLAGNPKWSCPKCASLDVHNFNTRTTATGVIKKQMKCKSCNQNYTISNTDYHNYKDARQTL